MKKLLILVLGLAVVFSVGGSLALAAPGDISPEPAFSDIAGHEAETALTVLGSLTVFTGSYGLGGLVNPDGVLTREQFCKVVVVAKGMAAEADQLKNMQPVQFKDADQISPWAWGYVQVAVGEGIINGYGDGTFQGSRPVTYAEAIKMLVCAIEGHREQTNPALGWPNQWVLYAVTNDFLDGVSPNPGANCTRGDMARMMFATMLIEPLKTDGTPESGKALLHELGANPNYWTGQFAGASGGNMTLSTWMGSVPLGDKVYVLGASSYAELAGTEVECAAKSDGKVVFIHRLAGTSNAGHFKELASDSAGDYIELKEGQKFYYTFLVHTTINGLGGVNQTDLESNDYVVVNTNADGKATAITATRYDLILRKFLLIPPAHYYPHEDAISDVDPASGVTPTRITFPSASPFWYYDKVAALWKPIHDATLQVGSGAVVKINGDIATPDDLQPGDVVLGATAGAKGYQDKNSIIEISATREVVDGTVVTNSTKTTAEGTTYWATIKVGGVDHEYQRDCGAPPFWAGYLSAELTVGQHYKLAENEEGLLFYNLGFTSANPIVYVKEASVSGSPPTVTYSITVDNMGVEQDLICTVNPTSWVNHFAQLLIDGATGSVTGAFNVNPTQAATVASAMASSVTLQSVPPGSTWFGEAPPCVVYRRTGPDQYTYIGSAGLSPGWEVVAYIGGGVPLVVVYEP